MSRCKAILEVTAGVIPGTFMPEHTKRWSYNDDDYAQDLTTAKDQPTVFSKLLDEAHEYAKGLSNPAYLNWVRTEWLWV